MIGPGFAEHIGAQLARRIAIVVGIATLIIVPLAIGAGYALARILG